MALNSLDIERSCINYFRPGINSIAFFYEDVKPLLGHTKSLMSRFPFLWCRGVFVRRKVS